MGQTLHGNVEADGRGVALAAGMAATADIRTGLLSITGI